MTDLQNNSLKKRTEAKNLLPELRSQGTGRLMALSALTFGIYAAHYIKRQTAILNRHISEDQKISNLLVWIVLISSYLHVGLFFAETIEMKAIFDQYITDYISCMQTVTYDIAACDKALILLPSQHSWLSLLMMVNMGVWLVLSIVWCFKARNRIHGVYGISAEDENAFKAIWLVLFWYFYLNYNVNKTSEKIIYDQL